MRSIAKQYTQTKFAEPVVRADSVKHKQDPRRYPRKPFFKSIVITYNDQKYRGVIKNVSRGGAFIETRAKFLFGEVIDMIVPSNGYYKGKRIRGWMVHSGRRGIGVTFKRIFERRSGKERRHAIDRRIGLDRRKRLKPRDRHREMNLLSPSIRL